MKVKSERDFWSGLMFVAIGIAFAWGATNYNFGSSAKPGPGYFPFGLGVLLAVLGAVVLFKSLTVETANGDPVGAFAWKPLVFIVATVAVFGWALPHLGMIIALPILVVVASLAGINARFTWNLRLSNELLVTFLGALSALTTAFFINAKASALRPIA